MSSITMHSVDISAVTPTEAQEFVAFHNQHYGTQRRPEHWIWEYSTFEPQNAIFAVARDKGKIVATQAMLPIYLQVGNEIFLTSKSENTLLLPEYRGKNVMKSFYNYAVEQCRVRGSHFVWGFTKATKALEKYGFSIHPVPQILVRPVTINLRRFFSYLDNLSSVKQRLVTAAKYTRLYLKHLRYFQLSPKLERTRHKISIGPIDLMELHEIQERISARYGTIITPLLSRKFIDWRIRNHPFLKYTEYHVHIDGKIQAYAFVVKQNLVVSISELVSINTQATLHLINHIMNDYRRTTAQFTILVNPEYAAGRDTIKALMKFGFFREGTLPFIIRDLSRLMHAMPLTLEKWNIDGIWTEGYTM